MKEQPPCPTGGVAGKVALVTGAACVKGTNLVINNGDTT
jgi:hypothetical protein